MSDVSKVLKSKKHPATTHNGEYLFASFVILYIATMVSSFFDQIPVQSWELLSLQDIIIWAEWMGENVWFPITLSIVYILFCFIGTYFFQTHPGFDKELRLPLAMWSLFLALFSWIGSLRTIPILVKIIQTKGLVQLICGDTRYDWFVYHPAGYWTLLFCLSKIPELLDTVFIVFRKKELITLHWYHHFTVLLYCWHAFATGTQGLIFAAMNLTVHTIMYMFYFFTALGYRPTTFALFITLGQILQMVVGTFVTLYIVLDKIIWHPVEVIDFSLHLPNWFFNSSSVNMKNDQCGVSSGNALFGFIMYGSYLGFFVHFFYKSYCVRKLRKE